MLLFNDNLNLQCSARVRHCLCFLVGVVDWCACRLITLICCRIILTARRPMSLLTSRSLTVRLSVLSSLLSGRVRSAVTCYIDLDPYGGTDPLGMFPLFLKRTADVMTPSFSVVFRRLVRLGSFLACWRQGNVTPIPKYQHKMKII